MTQKRKATDGKKVTLEVAEMKSVLIEQKDFLVPVVQEAVQAMLALKPAREIDRRVAPLGLTVEDAMERLKAVTLVCLGDRELGLWRLADSYPEAQREVLEVFPKIPTPLLSLRKSNKSRLINPRQGRS